MFVFSIKHKSGLSWKLGVWVWLEGFEGSARSLELLGNRVVIWDLGYVRIIIIILVIITTIRISNIY